jgi:hypothetical protein
VPERGDYFGALAKQQKLNLPYGLDIWADRKVLNVEWDADDTVDVIAFRPGDWETPTARVGR